MQSFTDEQQERFINHIADCHSWYKHFSLVTGGKFIIVTDGNAGLNYPARHPKLLFGNTLEGYRKEFGLLNYYWKDHSDVYFYSDCGLKKDMIFEEIEVQFPIREEIEIYPYLSNNFFESLNYHKSDFEKISDGQSHAQREKLISVLEIHTKYENYWQTILTDSERDFIIVGYNNASNSNISGYYILQNELFELLAQLRQIEINKIRLAIDRIKLLPA